MDSNSFFNAVISVGDNVSKSVGDSVLKSVLRSFVDILPISSLQISGKITEMLPNKVRVRLIFIYGFFLRND